MPADLFYKKIANQIPGLSNKLKRAGMGDSEADFVKRTIFSSFYMTTGIIICLALFFMKVDISVIALIFVFPILFLMMFFYFIKFPDVKILKLQRSVDREIVYAGRFLVIELESGISIYDSFVHISKNYPAVGRYLRNIVDDIDMGTTIDDALGKAVELTPSDNLRRLLWQIINSMVTGSDVATSLNSVLEQIVREQKIALNEYGRKLNPLAMFYMIIAVILPSIGVTMFVVMVSFMSIDMNFGSLVMIAFIMGFVQFLFYTIVKGSRPAGQFD